MTQWDTIEVFRNLQSIPRICPAAVSERRERNEIAESCCTARGNGRLFRRRAEAVGGFGAKMIVVALL